MYLGSRPAATVARWSVRPEWSLVGLGVPDYNAGWPIHHGQSKIKHHHYAAASSPLRRGADELRRMETAAPFLVTSRSLTEYQQWPKSEFELVGNEEESPWNHSSEAKSDCSSSHLASEMSISDETVLCGSTALSKKGSIEEAQTIERVKSETGEDVLPSDCSRVSPLAGRDFLETELVFNRHAHEMKLALPTRSTKTGRPSKRQTGTNSVCRPSACRKRVHPVGKFTDEFVNWTPQNGETDDEDEVEKDEDGDKDDVEFKHCIRASKSKCNGSHIVPVNVKRNSKRTSHLSRHHHVKRKRHQFTAERKEGGGIHRRRKQHNPWSIEETQMLIKGVSICGEGHWADIKRLEFSELASRSPVDLKDKWRNLLRLAQLTHNHIRNKKSDKRTDLPDDMLQQVRLLGTYQK